MFAQGEHPVGDRVPPRLVPGHDEQAEEVVELSLGQMFTVHLGLGQFRDEIFPRLLAPLSGEPVTVGRELHGGRAAERQEPVPARVLPVDHRAGVLGVCLGDHRIAELDAHRQVGVRDSHDPGQDPDRELAGYLLHEVELALPQGAIEHDLGLFAHEPLVPGGRAPDEQLAHEPP